MRICMAEECSNPITAANKRGYCTKKHKYFGLFCKEDGCNNTVTHVDAWCRSHMHIAVMSSETCAYGECCLLLRKNNNTGFCREHHRRKYQLDEHRLARRLSTRLSWYNMTETDYDLLVKSQNGLCPICNELLPGIMETHVDHDHRCCPGKETCGSCVRGVLHAKCNHLVGFIEASVSHLPTILTYIDKLK